MTGRNTRLMLGVLLGLLVVFAANAAVASIISDRQPADDLFDAAALTADQGMTPPADDRPSSPPDNGENPPTVEQLEALAPAGQSAGQPSSASQGGGSVSCNAVMPSTISHLFEDGLIVRIEGERRLALANPPPGGLFRPPRA